MSVRPSILCPIDFSESSAGALRYAAAIAEHFVTRLIVLTVEEPARTAAMDRVTGIHWTPTVLEQELLKFVSTIFGSDITTLALCEYEVAVGKPSLEILRVARERSCDLIVMSSHGLTGARKLVFGSTTERVLRETAVPILVTPAADPGPVHIEDASGLLRQIVVPVDLSPASSHQTRVAGGLAEALSLPVVLVHVIEPTGNRIQAPLDVGGLDFNERPTPEEQLDELAAIIPRSVRRETLIVPGDPAVEAARVVRDRQAGLVVMGLHGSSLGGPRMGSVTYRMLCLSPTLVLALPPRVAEPGEERNRASVVVTRTTGR